MAIPPGGDFSLSVSLSLSGERTRPIAKTSQRIKSKKNKYTRITLREVPLFYAQITVHPLLTLSIVFFNVLSNVLEYKRLDDLGEASRNQIQRMS